MMTGTVRIYGKDSCPYTTNARAAFAADGYSIDYVNVKADTSRIAEMLALSGGRRAVPVIVMPDGKVTIGYGGT